MASCSGSPASVRGTADYGDVVEIGLLLPVSWADALVEISRRKQQSVGQLLRGMIDRAIVDKNAGR